MRYAIQGMMLAAAVGVMAYMTNAGAEDKKAGGDTPEAMKAKKAMIQKEADGISLAMALITNEDTKESPAAMLLAAELLHRYPVAQGTLKADGKNLAGVTVPAPIDLVAMAKTKGGSELGGMLAKTEKVISEQSKGRIPGPIGGVSITAPYQTGVFQHRMRGGEMASARFNTIGGGSRSLTVTDPFGNIIAQSTGPAISLSWFVPAEGIYTLRAQNLEGYETTVNWFVQ